MMKLDPKQAKTAVAAALGLAVVFGAFRIYTLDANLKASAGITKQLKADLEKLQAENRSMQEASQTQQSEFGKISGELQTLRAQDAEAGKRSAELEKLVADAETTLKNQNARIAELEVKLKDAEERLQRQREKSMGMGAQPGSAGYTKLMEAEWLTAVAQTEAVQKELDGTLAELADGNAAKERMQREVATMHYNLAVILMQQNKFAAAAREYERVLQIRPDDPDAHYNLAVLYDTQFKDRAKALEHYRRYVEIAPDRADTGKVRLWIKDKEFEGRLDHSALLPGFSKEEKRF